MLDNPVAEPERDARRGLLENRYILKAAVLPVLERIDPNRFGCHVGAACFRSMQQNSCYLAARRKPVECSACKYSSNCPAEE